MIENFSKYKTIYGKIWETLNEIFNIISLEMSKSNQRISWDIFRTESKIFPLRAFLSFSKTGDKIDEDVVISANIFIKEDKILILTSDISEGDGLILAEGPELTLDSDIEQAIGEKEILNWLDKTRQFLMNNQGLLESSLKT